MNDPKTNRNIVRTKIGIVFQDFNLFPHMTVLKNISFAPIKLLKMSQKDTELLAHTLAEKSRDSREMECFSQGVIWRTETESSYHQGSGHAT